MKILFNYHTQNLYIDRHRLISNRIINIDSEQNTIQLLDDEKYYTLLPTFYEYGDLL